jgi:hypothetical protein
VADLQVCATTAVTPAELQRARRLVDGLGIDPVGRRLRNDAEKEIGTTGVAAAVANAVYHATAVRARDLPITLDKIVQQSA